MEHNSKIDGKSVGAVGLNAVDGLILVNLIVRGHFAQLMVFSHWLIYAFVLWAEARCR